MEMRPVVALALDLENNSDTAPDSRYVARVLLNFICACDLAGSKDEPPGFVSGTG